ncbi:MAG: phosphate ABC transporter substrate-binding protein PstS, partial [Candidatus Dormibacteraceae bacterium]
ELAYVLQSNLQQAYLKNADGQYLQATEGGASKAAAQANGISTTNFSITNQPGSESYPITTLSWLVIRADQKNGSRSKALVYLLRWLVTDGQSYGSALKYAPLPAPVRALALNQLKAVTQNGRAILS